MTKVRQLLLPVLVLGLIALAAFGVRQAVVSQEGPLLPLPPDAPARTPMFPDAFEREIVMPDPTLEAAIEASDEQGRQGIRDFIASGGDVCTLPPAEGPHGTSFADLPTLINSVDLIVVARPATHVISPPQPRTIVGEVITTFAVEQTLHGNPPGSTLTVASAQVVAGRELRLSVYSELDVCGSGPVLLLLTERQTPGEYGLSRYGWARIIGTAFEARDSNDLFDSFTTTQELLDGVLQIADDQAAQGLPKDLLFCEQLRSSGRFLNTFCPEEQFNPFRAFNLTGAARAVITPLGTAPGEPVNAIELAPGPELSALLAGLDTTVTLQSAGVVPEDAVSLTVIHSAPVRDATATSFWYSPSTGMVRLGFFGGQFPAPPAFVEAMQQFLVTP